MDLDERKIWLDGELVAWDRATVHVLSQSVQRGSLVFDVMSCHWLPDGAAVFGLRAHCRRFLNSANLSEMALPMRLDGIVNAIGETVRANPGAQIIKISAYYPSVSLDVLPRDKQATIAIAAFSAEDIYGRAAALFASRPAELQIASQEASRCPPPKPPPSWLEPCWLNTASD